jgi:hypothetical protein
MAKSFFIGLLMLVLPLSVIAAETVNLTNPLQQIDSLFQGSSYIGSVIGRVLGIIGAVALLMMVYGGLTMIMSGGNDKRIAAGKNIVTYTAIGLVIIFISYAAITFFLSTLGVTIQNETEGLQATPSIPTST